MDIVNLRYSFGGRSMFRMPPHWTAQLLMHKAGVPQEFIAKTFDIDPDRIRQRLLMMMGLMILAPYAAEIEALMARMPAYSDMCLTYEELEKATGG